MLTKILQLVHEISSLPEEFYKKGFPKLSSHQEVFRQKDTLKNFSKLKGKHLC